MAITATALEVYLLTRLDSIERELGAIKLALASAEPKTTSRSRLAGLFSRKPSLPIFWQTLFGGVAAWGIGQACKAYLDAGGKPLELIEVLLKLAL